MLDNLVNHAVDLSSRKFMPSNLWDSLNQLVDACKEFTGALREAGPMSIDSYIARNPEFDDIGRFAIALSMLNAEERSGAGGSKAYRNSMDNWQRVLFDRMFAQYNQPQLDCLRDSFAKVLTFNYDRSLPVAFNKYLSANFRSSAVAERERLLPVLHVYGNVRGDRGVAEYGDAYTFEEVLKTSRSIQIMHRGQAVASLELGVRVEALLRWAQRIFFLGFAFDPFNLDYIKLFRCLKPAPDAATGHSVFATTYGLPGTVIAGLARQFEAVRASPQFDNGMCSGVLERYL
jgi:hypothetical protein